MRAPSLLLFALCVATSGCAADSISADSGITQPGDSGTVTDTGTGTGGDGGTDAPDPFADLVVDYQPGAGAGFGQDGLPDIVLGPPEGGGESGGLDVLSLGEQGMIVLSFDDIGLVDGEGPDLLVFENPFAGWLETGVVGASEDGETWLDWPCDASDEEGAFPGCAGVGFVWANSDNGIDPTDPSSAGGDAFDLADLGLDRARYIRITDSGANSYEGVSGGFDLDAIAIVNGEPLND